MINLLDPEDLRQLRAARLNVKLFRFVTLSLIVVLGVGAVYGAGFWLALRDRAEATTKHQESEQQLAKYTDVASKATAYRQDLTIAKQILGNGMTFSTFLTDLGALMPPNTIVANLSVSTKTSGGQKAGTLSFLTRTKSYDDVLKIKQAFETSELFSDVKIVSTSVPEKPADQGIAERYPYEATFSVTVNALKGATK